MMRLFLITLSAFIFFSCSSTDKKEFEFDHNEPRHLSCYHAGDTVCFENAGNDVDTMIVLGVDSAKGEERFGLIAPKPQGKSCWVTIRFFPVDKWHGVTIDGNSGDTLSIDYQTLIRISKDPRENKTFFSFNFKDFYNGFDMVLGMLHTDTLMYNEKKITNYYVIEHGFPERVKDSTQIEAIIWTDQAGLTAYKNKKGDWWTKK